ncbi:hypothetical protein [Sphingomonas sp.]
MTGSTPRKRRQKKASPATDLEQLLAAAEKKQTPTGWGDTIAALCSAFDGFRKIRGTKGDQVCAYTQGTHWAVIDMFAFMQDQIDARDFVLRALLERIGVLEEQLGQQRSMIYRGVFDSAETYAPGSIVTHAGSMWHANEATSDTPGSSVAWTLTVKRGRDGRDAR